jgi:uncharacterized protein (DUF3084 family)
MTAANLLKFGSLGIAALSLLVILVVYQRSTNEDKLRSQLESVRGQMESESALITNANVTLEKANVALDKMNQETREALNRSLGALQEIEHGKLTQIAHGVQDPDLRSNLLDSVAQFCLRVADINAALAGKKDVDPETANKCNDIRKQ